jgi:signal transduction histidine kinase
MVKPEIPADEDARLRALLELAILDTPPEEILDGCVALAAKCCGTSQAMVSLIDRERQWLKAIYPKGSFPQETSRDVSFCGHAVAHDDVLVVNDASKDPRFADNPLVQSGLRFYAGVPLHARDGQPLGTLCVVDSVPRELSAEQLRILRIIADHIEQHLVLRHVTLELAAMQRDARAAQEILAETEARRRDTTAMLVHDLKNPLAAVTLIAEHVRRHPDVPPDARRALADVVASAEVAERMVVDALDVARSDTGALRARFVDFDLAAIVGRLLCRVRYLAEERQQTLELDSRLDDPIVRGDSTLIARALRNLLDNAFKYAPEGQPIRVELRAAGGDVEIRVADDGPTVPAAMRGKIFDEYFRAEELESMVRPSHGLGLALCAIVAQLHRGRAWVEPGPAERGNVFVLRMQRR